jgi:ComF family protein
VVSVSFGAGRNGRVAAEYRNGGANCQLLMRQLVDRCVAAIMPWRCVLCGGRACGIELCPACLDDLPWTRESVADATAVAAFDYEWPVDRWVTALKFRQRRALARVLGELLAIRVREAWHAGHGSAPDGVVPVPLGRERRRQRGYNQAELIAGALCADLQLPCEPAILRRDRDTRPQTDLTGPRRRDNVRDAFRAASVPPGSHVAVVDDVLTTGATAAACATALLAAGAGRVSVWTVARTRSGRRRLEGVAEEDTDENGRADMPVVQERPKAVVGAPLPDQAVLIQHEGRADGHSDPVPQPKARYLTDQQESQQ